jgi:hypothetical protein
MKRSHEAFPEASLNRTDGLSTEERQTSPSADWFPALGRSRLGLANVRFLTVGCFLVSEVYRNCVSRVVGGSRARTRPIHPNDCSAGFERS